MRTFWMVAVVVLLAGACAQAGGTDTVTRGGCDKVQPATWPKPPLCPHPEKPAPTPEDPCGVVPPGDGCVKPTPEPDSTPEKPTPEPTKPPEPEPTPVVEDPDPAPPVTDTPKPPEVTPTPEIDVPLTVTPEPTVAPIVPPAPPSFTG